MLGSHDSFTYLKSTRSVMNYITRWWRCQDKSISEQYAMGVRLFDVRLMRDTVNGKKVWRAAHGLATLEKVYSSLKSCCVYFLGTLKGCKLRLWMESGSDSDWEEFKAEVDPLIKKYPNLVQVVRKHPETVYYNNYGMNMHYYSFNDWNAGSFLKHLGGSSPIREWAQNNNPAITQEMIDDPNNCYFMDFVTGVPTADSATDAEVTEEMQAEIDKLNN